MADSASSVAASTAVTGAAPDSSSAIARRASPTSDQFLHLLVVQLRQQDPLNPLRDSDFTAQLVQFSSLEQLAEINQNLLGLGGIQQGLVNAQALNLLGRQALVSGGTVRVSAGRPDEMLVDVPKEAQSVKVLIRNASGSVVRTVDVTAAAGRSAVAWDGTDDAGRTLADGEYTAEVVATDASGGAVEASLMVALRIDGVSFTDGVVRLTCGGREVPFDEILEIREI